MTLEEYQANYERQVRSRIYRRYHIAGDDLDDVMAEVMIKVWRALERDWVRDGSEPMAWLTIVGYNVAVDWLRRRSHRPVSVGTCDPYISVSIDPDPWPDETATRAETRVSVRRAVAQLPTVQRAVIDHLYFRGLTHTQTARAVGIPLGTVKTRTRLAYRKLATLLQEAV